MTAAPQTPPPGPTPPTLPPRALWFLRGSPAATRAETADRLRGLPRAAVCWATDGSAAPPIDGWVTVSQRHVTRLLGQSFDAVVLDGHGDLNPDVLGAAEGLVRGGGWLVLRLPPEGQMPAGAARLCAPPFTAEAVGRRWRTRLERLLDDAPTPPPGPAAPPPRARRGTAEQAQAVRSLTAHLRASAVPAPPHPLVLLADRGRGKSSALGLAVAASEAERLSGAPIALTADRESSVAEVLRHAGPRSGLRYVDPVTLACEDGPWHAVLVDEAAQLSVPLLQRIVARHRGARLVFSSTVRGYEGTGRGFALRFLKWLQGACGGVQTVTLDTPIRWANEDPLEAWVARVLLLRAAPRAVDRAHLSDGPVSFQTLDRDAWVADSGLLSQVFGLLVHAHYRTTPADLERMLDAPNLALHIGRVGDVVVAVTLTAEEGRLSADEAAQLARGRARLRGHALTESLAVHAGVAEASTLRLVRSVRIATHPGARRRGLARELVQHVHRACPDTDLFGTVFGATPELLSFRRHVGYELVRLGAARGARTGEPSATMVRPATAAGEAVFRRLRLALARELPVQLGLHARGPWVWDRRLTDSARLGLPATPPWDAHARDAIVAAYVHGPRTFESCASAIIAFLEAHQEALAALPRSDSALLRARALERLPWDEATAAASMPSRPAAMRAFRRAVRALWEASRGPDPA